MSMIDRNAPDFEADAYLNGEFKKVRLSDYKGKWVVLFFYPADYTFVCPTEIAGFADDYEKFKSKNCDVLSVSSDTVHVHKAWTESDPRINKVRYPMLADRTGAIARAYAVYNDTTGNAFRGLFIINPEGVVKYEVITADSVGRSTEETFRVLCALQNGSMCPVNWHVGDPTINGPKKS
jgi:alkyl hydroperoxide reductase subunit AhpC